MLNAGRVITVYVYQLSDDASRRHTFDRKCEQYREGESEPANVNQIVVPAIIFQ